MLLLFLRNGGRADRRQQLPGHSESEWKFHRVCSRCNFRFSNVLVIIHLEELNAISQCFEIKWVEEGIYQSFCLFSRGSRSRGIHPGSRNTDKVDDHVGNGDRRWRCVDNSASYIVQSRVERFGQFTDRKVNPKV